MGGVCPEIDQHLVNRCGVGQDGQPVSRDARLQRDGGRDRGAKELQGILRDGDDVHRPPLRRFLPAEGEDLVHEVLCPVAGIQNLCQVPSGLAVDGVVQGKIGEADDGEKDVVEVVGDAACQRADGLHLLRLAQLPLEFLPCLLGPFQTGDVHGREHDARPQIPRIDGGRTEEDVDDGAVLCLPAGLYGSLPRVEICSYFSLPTRIYSSSSA